MGFDEPFSFDGLWEREEPHTFDSDLYYIMDAGVGKMWNFPGLRTVSKK